MGQFSTMRHGSMVMLQFLLTGLGPSEFSADNYNILLTKLPATMSDGCTIVEISPTHEVTDENQGLITCNNGYARKNFSTFGMESLLRLDDATRYAQAELNAGTPTIQKQINVEFEFTTTPPQNFRPTEAITGFIIYKGDIGVAGGDLPDNSDIIFMQNLTAPFTAYAAGDKLTIRDLLLQLHTSLNY